MALLDLPMFAYLIQSQLSKKKKITRKGGILFENTLHTFLSRYWHLTKYFVLTEWLYTAAHRCQKEPDGHSDNSAGIWC